MSITTSPTRMHPITDSLTMLRRNLLHNLKSPVGTIIVIAIPMIFLLLFVYVFGGTLGAGLGGDGDRSEYLTYITPAILLMGAASASQMIAVWISTDISEGIIARFRTMSISPGSVLAGHAYGGLIQAIVSVAALLGVAVLIGFRPAAAPLHWFALVGFVILIGFALSWLSVGFGLAAKGPETASNLTMLLILLPLLSGGFVPVDSMPEWLQGFAQYQPFTPIIETLRGLLSGTPNGADVLIAVVWLIGIALVGYIWSRWLYRRRAASR